MKRPYVILKAAISLDGFLDDITNQRTILSSKEDLEAVDELRSTVDAILVGAETLRRDKARLVIKSDRFRQKRVAAGMSENPIKVTLSSSGNLPADLPFFSEGDSKKLIYRPVDAANSLVISEDIEEVRLAGNLLFSGMLEDLYQRGVRRLLVEGGARLHQEFINSKKWDEVRIAVAPILLGDAGKIRLFDTLTPLEKVAIRSVHQLGQMGVIFAEAQA